MRGEGEVERCPWDADSDQEEDGEDEAWLFSSLSRYSQLYMYSIGSVPNCLAVSPCGAQLAVATQAELAVYAAPGRLLAASNSRDNLTPSRDFRVVAGTVKAGLVEAVTWVGSAGLVTSRAGLAVLDSWRREEDGDLLPGPVCSSPTFHPRLLAGAGEGLVVAAGQTGLGRWDQAGNSWDERQLAEEAASLAGGPAHLAAAVDRRGRVCQVDWRAPGLAAAWRMGSDCGENWASCCLPGEPGGLVAGWSRGRLTTWDGRQPGAPVCEVAVAVPPSLQPGQQLPRLHSTGSALLLAAQGSVRVFGQAGLGLQFEHEGHSRAGQGRQARVTALAAHPAHRTLVFSGDDREKLHAWMYNPNTT